MIQIVHRFTPLIRKYSSQLGYDEAYSDLIIWIVNCCPSVQIKRTRKWVNKNYLKKFGEWGVLKRPLFSLYK